MWAPITMEFPPHPMEARSTKQVHGSKKQKPSSETINLAVEKKSSPASSTNTCRSKKNIPTGSRKHRSKSPTFFVTLGQKKNRLGPKNMYRSKKRFPGPKNMHPKNDQRPPCHLLEGSSTSTLHGGCKSITFIGQALKRDRVLNQQVCWLHITVQDSAPCGTAPARANPKTIARRWLCTQGCPECPACGSWTTCTPPTERVWTNKGSGDAQPVFHAQDAIVQGTWCVPSKVNAEVAIIGPSLPPRHLGMKIKASGRAVRVFSIQTSGHYLALRIRHPMALCTVAPHPDYWWPRRPSTW